MRADAVFVQMMEIGIYAIPIVGLMAATIGVMLAIQGIFTLRLFGAESRVTIGIVLSVTREFAPLITGILVAGRSGSALAARIGTMKINQEIDALKVMGINPVRFLVVPALLATLVMVPCLTFFSDMVALFAAGLYVKADLGLTLSAYLEQVIDVLTVDHLMHGLDHGAKMYCVDPRRTSSSKFAVVWLGIDVGTDIALSNTIAREIIHAGLVDLSFVERATTGFDEYAESNTEGFHCPIRFISSFSSSNRSRIFVPNFRPKWHKMSLIIRS